ncbi:MAG TPA: hypothetical protein VG605_08935 [Puia sp.]|nr:hypothetical protein [Puia sp.]
MPAKEYANKPYYSESSAGQRMVRGYPPCQLFSLFQDYITVEEMSMSQGVAFFLKAFFDRMTPEEKAVLRDRAAQMRIAIKKTA